MAIMLAPQINTKRLILWDPQLTDAAAIYAAYTHSAEVAKYMVWRPHTALTAAEAFLQTCVEAWHKASRYPFVLALNGA